MASITIRQLDEKTKKRLRLRAAEHGTSMEEEARRILRTALSEQPHAVPDLASAIRLRFEPLGGLELRLPPPGAPSGAARARRVFDAQIAAITSAIGAAVATRNVADFQGCGIDVIDPWRPPTP